MSKGDRRSRLVNGEAEFLRLLTENGAAISVGASRTADEEIAVEWSGRTTRATENAAKVQAVVDDGTITNVRGDNSCFDRAFFTSAILNSEDLAQTLDGFARSINHYLSESYFRKIEQPEYLHGIMQNIFGRNATLQELEDFLGLVNAKRFAAAHIKQELQQLVELAQAGKISKQDVLDKMNQDAVFDLALVMSVRETAMSINLANERKRANLTAIKPYDLDFYLNGQNRAYAHYFFHHPNCQSCEELYAATAAAFSVIIENTNLRDVSTDDLGNYKPRTYNVIKGNHPISVARVFALDGRHYKAVSHKDAYRERRAERGADAAPVRRGRESGMFDLGWDAEGYNRILSRRTWLTQHSIARLNHEIFGVREDAGEVDQFAVVGSVDQLLTTILQFRENPVAQKLSTVINVGHHWVALHLRKTGYEGEIIAQYADSLHPGGFSPPRIEQVLMAAGVATEVDALNCEQQRDGHSCGYHALFNVMRMHQAEVLETDPANVVVDLENEAIEGVTAFVERGFDLIGHPVVPVAASSASSTASVTPIDDHTDIADIIAVENHEGLQQYLFDPTEDDKPLDRLRKIADFSEKVHAYYESLQAAKKDGELVKAVQFLSAYDFRALSQDLIHEYIEARLLALEPLENEAMQAAREQFFDEIIAKAAVNVEEAIALIEEFEQFEKEVAASSTSDDEIDARAKAMFAKPVGVPDDNDARQQLLMYYSSYPAICEDAGEAELDALVKQMAGDDALMFFDSERKITPLQAAISANNLKAVKALLAESTAEDFYKLILAKNKAGYSTFDALQGLIMLKKEEAVDVAVLLLDYITFEANYKELHKRSAKINLRIEECFDILEEQGLLKDSEALQEWHRRMYGDAEEIAEPEEVQEPEVFAAISKDADFAGISLMHKRRNQTPTAFVGIAKGDAAINPKKFLDETVKAIAKDHEECETAATLCAAIASYDSTEDRVTIVTSHIGRSSAVAVVKFVMPNGSFAYRSVALTQEHTIHNPHTVEYLEAVEGEQWDLEKEGVENLVFGLVGAQRFGNRVIRKPDLKTFTAGSIISLFEDDSGLAGAMPVDLDLIITENKVAVDVQLDRDGKSTDLINPEGEYNICVLKTVYDDEVTKGKIDPTVRSFAQYLEESSKKNPQENAIVVMPLIQGGRIMLQEGSPLIAAVSEGLEEGLTIEDDASVEDYKNALKYDKDKLDGSVVANSVLAQLCEAAEAEEIAGLEIDPDLQRDFFNMRLAHRDINREKQAAALAAAALGPVAAPTKLPLEQLPVRANFHKATIEYTMPASLLYDKAEAIKNHEDIFRERLTIDKSDFLVPAERKAEKARARAGLPTQAILLTPDDIRFTSCAGEDFGHAHIEGEVGPLATPAIDSSTYIRLEGKYKDLFHVDQGRDDGAFQAYFANFGGMYFREEPNENPDGSQNLTKKKFFGKDVCLYRPHFRATTFENVDFSEMDPKIFLLMRIDYSTCNFINCKYPRGIMMTDKNVPVAEDKAVIPEIERLKKEFDDTKLQDGDKDAQAAKLQAIVRRLESTKMKSLVAEFHSPSGKLAPVSVGSLSSAEPIHDHGKPILVH